MSVYPSYWFAKDATYQNVLKDRYNSFRKTNKQIQTMEEEKKDEVMEQKEKTDFPGDVQSLLKEAKSLFSAQNLLVLYIISDFMIGPTPGGAGGGNVNRMRFVDVPHIAKFNDQYMKFNYNINKLNLVYDGLMENLNYITKEDIKDLKMEIKSYLKNLESFETKLNLQIAAGVASITLFQMAGAPANNVDIPTITQMVLKIITDGNNIYTEKFQNIVQHTLGPTIQKKRRPPTEPPTKLQASGLKTKKLYVQDIPTYKLIDKKFI